MIKIVTFEQLSVQELYGIMALRQEVFVVEQNCVYLDADGIDTKAYHLMLLDDKQNLVAYTRLMPRGVVYDDYTVIGRVVSSPSVRGKGIGRQLMMESIKAAHDLFGNTDIKIGAQSYLHQFYMSLGFAHTGKNYIEDGIPHQEMIYKFQ